MRSSLGLLALLVVKASAAITVPSPAAMREAFTVFRIVPQIIPVAPDTPVIDIYGDCVVNLGNRIPPWCTVIPPFTTWSNANMNTLYTLIAIDPDTPQYFTTKGTQFLYGLVVNIPGPNLEKGDILSPYVPPAPLPGSGDHRYICLIYKQQSSITVTTDLLISISQNIWRFNIAEFVMRYKLGNPVAGNFFRSRQSLWEAPCGKKANNCCDKCPINKC